MESSKLINYCTKMCCNGKTSWKSLPRMTGPYPTDVYWWWEQYFSEIKCRCHRQILHKLPFQQKPCCNVLACIGQNPFPNNQINHHVTSVICQPQIYVILPMSNHGLIHILVAFPANQSSEIVIHWWWFSNEVQPQHDWMQRNPHQKTSSIPGIPKLKSNPQTRGQNKFFAV